ncbi:MAG: amidohydrolase family protein [Gammaproteobacteria bacterium]
MADSNNLSRAFFVGVGVISAGMLLLILALPTTNPAATPGNTTIAIVGAKVFDGQRWLADTDILIEAGRISAMGSALDLPDGARRVDARDLSVLPGLIDAHVHSYGGALRDSVRFGVTTNFDMFTAPVGLPQTRAARESLDNIEADLFSAGMLATVDGGHGTQYGVPVATFDTDTDASKWVAQRKAEGSDYIKLVYMPYQNRLPSLDLTTATAIIQAAHAADMLAVAHISTAQAALDLINADVDGLVHIFADQPASDELIQAARERDVFVIPTLCVLATADRQDEGAKLAADPRFTPYLTDPQNSSLGSDFGLKVPGMTLAGALENVRRLHAGGVRILGGSDAPNPGTTHGASLHQELALLVRAGLSESEALTAATSAAADAFGVTQRGSLAVGQRADMIIVEGDPAKDILATRAIVHVLRNGMEVARAIETGTAKSMPLGALSDFSQRAAAPGGFIWSATDDRDMRGKSDATLTHIAPTVAQPLGAVRVAGEVRTGFPYPWAGFSFGAADGQPRDMGEAATLSMNLRGTPGIYRVMFFNAGSSGAPPTQEITVSDTWQTFNIRIADLNGLNRRSVAGFAIVAGPAPGAFRLDLAEVSLN